MSRLLSRSSGALLLCAVLVGCANDNTSTKSSTTSINQPIPTTAKPKFAYTGNEGNSLSGYSVNTATGALTALSGFPLNFGANPTTVAHDPQNRFLFVGDISSGYISVFTINGTTGALTFASSINNSQPTSNNLVYEPVALAVDPSGTHLYALGAGPNVVSAYSINSAGVLTPVSGQPFSTGGSDTFLDALAINAAGTFLYTQNANSVSVFAVTAATGALSLVQTVTGIGSGAGGALDPGGNFFYVADATKNVILAYSINASTGMLTLADTSPMALGASYTLAVSPTGQFAYTIENTTNLVAYSINNGVFKSIQTTTGLFALKLTVDPSGSFVYAPQACSANCPGGVYNVVSEFAIGSTGALTSISGSPVTTGITPTGITITTQ